jgi:hypothetical protein
MTTPAPMLGVVCIRPCPAVFSCSIFSCNDIQLWHALQDIHIPTLTAFALHHRNIAHTSIMASAFWFLRHKCGKSPYAPIMLLSGPIRHTPSLRVIRVRTDNIDTRGPPSCISLCYMDERADGLLPGTFTISRY